MEGPYQVEMSCTQFAIDSVMYLSIINLSLLNTIYTYITMGLNGITIFM